jgi:hypothetical protein
MTLPAAVKSIAILCFGALLTWQVASRTLVAHLVTASLDTAQRIAPSDPMVLTALAANAADAVVRNKVAAAADGNPSSPPYAPEQIRQWAEAALVAAPLNPTALRILGQLEDDAGNTVRAEALMERAVRLSNQETAALFWLLKRAYDTRDLSAAARHSNALLSTRPVAQFVVPVLARIAEDPMGKSEVQRLLASNPRWRSAFFALLPQHLSDARMPLELLTGLKNTSVPATPTDYAPYLNFLLQNKFYDLAYYSWLQSLPAAQLSGAGLIFNGSFEETPSGAPFDWVLKSGSGVLAELTQGPDLVGRQGLFVQFQQGRVEFGGVNQIILLAPGPYKLTGKYRGELSGRRGLEWQVTCLNGAPEPIGHTAPFLGVARGWKDFAADFKVPSENCRAQSLKLVHTARSSSEQFITGSIWFDDLEIKVPAGN